MTLSLAALFVILGTSFSWAALDLLRKLLVRTIRPVALLVLLSLAQTAVFAVWVAVDAGARITAAYWWPALGSVALNIVANVAFIEALRRAPLSLTIPLLSLTPALATLLAVPLVGEVPTFLQGLGVALVVAGALALNLDGTTIAGLGRALAHQRGTQLMVVVAVGWSLASPLDKLALAAATSSVHSFGVSLGVALGSLAILAVRRQLGDLRAAARAPALTAAALAVAVVGLAFNFLALTMAWVALVETFKRAIGNLTSVVLGRAFFGEPVTAVKVAAVCAMALGVGLILS